jgi:hypothetical protein
MMGSKLGSHAMAKSRMDQAKNLTRPAFCHFDNKIAALAKMARKLCRFDNECGRLLRFYRVIAVA